MIKFLIFKFIKNYENTEDEKVRESYGILSGILGIICNGILFIIKIIIGFIMNSIAILSDGFNNLSDMGSSLVTLIGTKISNRKPDRLHPFGHGRMEYISTMAVAVIIMMVGIELLEKSFQKILHPVTVIFSPLLIAILSISIFLKLWMFLYNRYMGNKVNSGVILATSKDSLNDCIATGAVVISIIAGRFLPDIPVDGIVGSIVSVIIIFTGLGIIKDTVSLLLGKAPDPEIVKKLEKKILSVDEIIGQHDLIIHDYGPGRVMASVHAEVPDTSNIVEIHEIIDKLEQEILYGMNINMVIHVDPVSMDTDNADNLKNMVKSIVKGYSSKFSIHDFRVSDGGDHKNIIFDMLIPVDFPDKKANLVVELIKDTIEHRNPGSHCVINLDRDYISR